MPGDNMHNRLTTVNESDPMRVGCGLREFDEEELRGLEEKGITPHHLARFLEALRNNLDPSSLGRFLNLLQESQGENEGECYFV